MKPADIEATRHEVMLALERPKGSLWQDVRGEWQRQYSEMPIWILLYADSDVALCHGQVCDILEPAMEKLAPEQFTVSYTVITEDAEIQVAFFEGNEEILEARGSETIGTAPDVSRRKEGGVFGAAVSAMTPTA